MSKEQLRFEAMRQEDAQFEASVVDYHEAGYESPVTEWEKNFWEAGYRRGVDAALSVTNRENGSER